MECTGKNEDESVSTFIPSNYAIDSGEVLSCLKLNWHSNKPSHYTFSLRRGIDSRSFYHNAYSIIKYEIIQQSRSCSSSDFHPFKHVDIQWPCAVPLKINLKGKKIIEICCPIDNLRNRVIQTSSSITFTIFESENKQVNASLFLFFYK